MPMTTAGRNFLASALVGSGTAFDSSNAHIGVGDGTTAFAVSQTDLVGSNKVRIIVDGAPSVTTNAVEFVATFGSSDGNFDWQEFGLFNAASSGTMFSRLVSDEGTKASGQTWVAKYTQTIVNGDS